jgi:hypothetical protein
MCLPQICNSIQAFNILPLVDCEDMRIIPATEGIQPVSTHISYLIGTASRDGMGLSWPDQLDLGQKELPVGF